ncbi:MAG: threonine synthase [Armatimonadetes bacterium]|nr:threonine synthase [Armatimonadota bacterium]
MGPATHLTCVRCGKDYAPGELTYVCPCSSWSLLWVHYDYEAAAERLAPAVLRNHPERGIARYLPLLPVERRESLPPMAVGGTPLLPVPGYGRSLGLPRLHLKDDTRNPTGSFKDRASAVGVAVARERSETLVTGASTGNAASSLAGMAAASGIRTIIFVPASAPEAKLTQLLVYGATVLAVQGSYDQAFELSLEATRRFGWYNRNTGYNPVLLEGKKTVSLEIWEDLGHRVPDAVIVAVGDGCIIGGVGKGFMDLQRMGQISKLPRIYGAQAEGSSVLAKAFESGGPIRPEPDAHTYADSICVGEPRAADPALLAVNESGGGFVVVSDDEIRSAQIELARATGIFAEPAGATSVAGLRRLVELGLLSAEDRVVAILTGHGLKDIQGARSAVGSRPHRIVADPDRLEPTLGSLGLL